jgi:hypothetical protein
MKTGEQSTGAGSRTAKADHSNPIKGSPLLWRLDERTRPHQAEAWSGRDSSSTAEFDGPGVEEPSRPVNAVVSRLLAAGRTRRYHCAQAGSKP